MTSSYITSFSRYIVFIITISTNTRAFVTPSKGTTHYHIVNVYIPDGLTAEEWAKIKANDKSDKGNLGANGPRGYRSRSFESYQKALEKGDNTAKNMAVFFAKDKLARGEITKADIPYMQRGGSWDNSDVKGIKGWYNSKDGGLFGKKWTDVDKAYDRSGAKEVGALTRKEKTQLNNLKAQKEINKMNTQEFYDKLGAIKKIRKAPKIDVGYAKEGFKFPWQK